MFAKLEKKFGKYAIKGLMKYVTVVFIVGYIISIAAPGFYDEYMCLDMVKVTQNFEIWRFLTFVIQPVYGSNLLLAALSLLVGYFIGNTLEMTWGSFRFNVFYFMGILFNILGTVVWYLITGYNWEIPFTYIDESLFLAFAVSFPNMQFMFMFILPVKAYMLVIIDGVFIVSDIIKFFRLATVLGVFSIVALGVSLLNFLVFYLIMRKDTKFIRNRDLRKVISERLKNQRRAEELRRSREGGDTSENNGAQEKGKIVYPFGNRPAAGISRHKCCICGRTELDNPDLEFRFCTKCNGNYEYCSDHIYTHEHKTDENVNQE